MRVRVVLPPVPQARGDNAWEPLRREVRTFGLRYKILGLSSQGRPTIELEGNPVALRAWLDNAGYRDVKV